MHLYLFHTLEFRLVIGLGLSDSRGPQVEFIMVSPTHLTLKILLLILFAYPKQANRIKIEPMKQPHMASNNKS